MANSDRYAGMFQRLLANSHESDRYSFEGSPCWEWDGYISPKGYGRFSMRVPTKPYPVLFAAHRELAVLALGKPLPPDTTIEHACTLPWCIHWLHFETATRAENSRDMQARRWNKPRLKFKRLIDLELYTYDPLIRSLPVLRSTLVNAECPF